MKPKTSFIVSVSRGAVISGILICLLPAVAGAGAIWFAMPLTELIVAVYVVMEMRQFTKQLPDGTWQSWPASCRKLLILHVPCLRVGSR